MLQIVPSFTHESNPSFHGANAASGCVYLMERMMLSPIVNRCHDLLAMHARAYGLNSRGLEAALSSMDNCLVN
jgi:hypothetical protein